jgi:hypothetical protein
MIAKKLSDDNRTDKEMQAAGLGGRVFPAVGNHEVSYDSDVQGLLASFPYLKKLGVTDKNLVYRFDYRDVRFIFLWTGKYDYRDPTGWSATRPAYEEQMKQLRLWLDEAKAKGIKKVFIAFHAPVFARAGFGPISPEDQNPHKTIAAYAKDLDIVVFNGYIHTIELFEVDGVKYLLCGGGGAEQDPILFCPAELISRFLTVTRPICTGKANRRRKTTTGYMSTSAPISPRNLRSIAFDPGLTSRLRVSSYLAVSRGVDSCASCYPCRGSSLIP